MKTATQPDPLQIEDMILDKDSIRTIKAREKAKNQPISYQELGKRLKEKRLIKN